MRRLAPVVAVLIACAAAPSAAGAASDLWVSPHGRDANAGTRTAPLRTLAAARDAARARSGRVRVSLLGGTYRLRAPLRLDARDSGVTWRAAPGAHPVVSGAVRVRGWRLYDRAKGIYRARVAHGTRTRQLFVAGRRAVRARSAPNPEGFVRTPTGYTAPDDRMAHWGDPTGIELVTTTQWKSMRCPVASIRGREITMAQPCWTNVNVFPVQWSFQLVSEIENAYALLDEPGEWYLDSRAGWLYYAPRAGEDLRRADVELPIAAGLIVGRGTREHPIADVRLRGLEFTGATWLGPSGRDGYAADQGGFHLVGPGHEPNPVGHDPRTVGTPGAVAFDHARDVEVRDSRFAALGAVGLELGTGSQGSRVAGNRFEDISGAAIQVGGTRKVDSHPRHAGDVTRDNRITDNVIAHVAVEYYDAPGIAIGFTTRSTVAHNDISDVPWAGIAIGWGWGLVDPGRFAGLPGTDQLSARQSAQWGIYATPSTSRGNRILRNRIHRFLMRLWDGGAIYTQGQQGTSAATGELIAGNVAFAKRPAAGGNVFYTDGGSRFVTLRGNVSLDNPPGTVDFGPCLASGTDLGPLCALTGQVAYGSDRGGCRPHGDLVFEGDWFEHPAFFVEVCPYPPYPVDVTAPGLHTITGPGQVPRRILEAAGPRT